LKLRQGGLPSLNALKEVKVYLYPAGINLTGSITKPKNADEAKFSLRYTVATALTKGHFTLKDLDAAKGLDKETRGVISKIEIISEPKLENRAANTRRCPRPMRTWKASCGSAPKTFSPRRGSGQSSGR
jgi:2-methylcitrate dehydratase PrpD